GGCVGLGSTSSTGIRVGRDTHRNPQGRGPLGNCHRRDPLDPGGLRAPMKVSELRAAIERDMAAGDRPMLVAGTAGTVSTGAVDPLEQIADVCSELGVWFHVDGAYGALAANVDGTPEDLRAIALADSVAVRSE